MLDPSLGPAIPHRTSARTVVWKPTSKKQAPRRRSVPAASHLDAKRRTSNHVVVKPASTEVIASLIETLSAISSPADHHVSSPPGIATTYSTPASPRPRQGELPLVTEPTNPFPQGDSRRPSLFESGTDFDARKRFRGAHDKFFLHLERSSIETYSPRRPSPEKSLEENAKIYDLQTTCSIGNPSIEPKPSTTTISSDRSDGSKSCRLADFSSGLKDSRDSLRDSNDFFTLEPVVEGKHTHDRLKRGKTPPGPDTLVVSKRGAGNSVAAEPPNISTRASSVQSTGSLGRPYYDLEDLNGEFSGCKKKHSIPNEDYIPTRTSSMRHSLQLSPSRHTRRSQSSESSNNMEPSKSLLENRPDVLEQVLPELPDEFGEDLVNRRIRELKDQKIERERSSSETPAEFFSAPQTPDRSLTPSSGAIAPLPISVYSRGPESKPNAAVVQQPKCLDDVEMGAPSPAIAQGIKRDKGARASSVEAKAARQKNPSIFCMDDNRRSSITLPQRSSSRLLKRFSRPISPAPRRTVSNNLLETKRNTSSQLPEANLASDAVDKYLQSSRLSQKISEPRTGRVISFSEVGDPDGSVIFCCVGMGLTRFITAFYDELASTLKLRLVTPDRPGVGASEPHADGLDTPLGWPDDVRAICESLNIKKFSILAHSAGAIYALATALRMPQHIRCRVHLLAPWIPPSQMYRVGAQQDPSPAKSLPYSQRFLRSLPTTFLKAANSSFLSATSASVTTSLPKTPRRYKRRSLVSDGPVAPELLESKQGIGEDPYLSPKISNSEMVDFFKENRPHDRHVSTPINGRSTAQVEKERRSMYDARLTDAIWNAATTGANPAVDLLVCLERRQPIGFRYVDITRSVVIHHGSKDSRVRGMTAPTDWLGNSRDISLDRFSASCEIPWSVGQRALMVF